MRYPGTWLYAPGNRPDVLAKAISSGAATVIADLQDAVSPDLKAAARRAVLSFLTVAHDLPGDVDVVVRVNEVDSDEGRRDLDALAASPHVSCLTAIRIPKVSSPDDLAVARETLGPNGPTLDVLIETAAGVENITSIVGYPTVSGVCLGEGDLAVELGITDEKGFDWIRSRTVIAAASAGLPAPPMSVFGNIDDFDGLRRSCDRGRRLGMRGRSAIHPRQLPVIADAFAPTADEIAMAQRIVQASELNAGASVLPDGTFIDRPVVKAAERTLLWNSFTPNIEEPS